MRISPDRRLFWFLKEGVSLDLSDASQEEMVVQQVVTRGRAEDVRALLRAVPRQRLRETLVRLKRFLPAEVRMFWEDFVAGHQ